MSAGMSRTASMSSGLTRTASVSSGISGGSRGTRNQPRKDVVHPELSAITYLCGVKYVKRRGFKDLSVPCDLMNSFKETLMLKLTQNENVRKQWADYNISHLR